jgi:hypothetical protein
MRFRTASASLCRKNLSATKKLMAMNAKWKIYAVFCISLLALLPSAEASFGDVPRVTASDEQPAHYYGYRRHYYGYYPYRRHTMAVDITVAPITGITVVRITEVVTVAAIIRDAAIGRSRA